MKKIVIPSPKSASPYSIDMNSMFYLTTNSELDSSDPFVTINSMIIPAITTLTLSIRCKTDEILADRSIASASPIINSSVAYYSTPYPYPTRPTIFIKRRRERITLSHLLCDSQNRNSQKKKYFTIHICL